MDGTLDLQSDEIARFRLALELSPTPMMLVAPDGAITATNAELDALFGYRAGELAGQPVDCLVPVDDRAAHPELRRAYFTLPAKRRMGAGRDLTGVASDGRQIPVEIGLDPVVIGEGTWVLASLVDIGERQANERRLRQALDAAASAMVMIDQDGIIALVNRAACELLGYEEDELVGQAIEQLVPEPARTAHHVYRSSYLVASHSRRMGGGRRLTARRKDGSEVPVEIGLTPMEMPDGRFVMSTIVDISERRAFEASLAAKCDELERLNQNLSRFAYSASHDLKAPLASISGLLACCQEDLEAGNLEELAGNLEQAFAISARSARKVEDVLKLARTSAAPGKADAVILADLVAEIWQDLTAGLENPPRLDTEFGHREPLMTEAAALKVVVENVLGNAVKYGDPAKRRHRISVTSQNGNDEVAITIADNGVGMSKADAAVVFEMFQRFDPRSGDGLGMALAQQQAQRLGGRIQLTSRKGRGTRLTLFLPQSEESIGEE